MISDIVVLLTSPWLYALVMLSITLDVFLPVLPSGSLLIVATVYTADNGDGATIPLLLLGGAAASALGDNLAFRLIRQGSAPVHRLLDRMPRVARVNDHLREALRARTMTTVFFARFVPTGRTVVAAVAATDPRMRFTRFRIASAATALAWASYTVGLGYLNALLFDTSWVSVAVGVAAVSAVGAVVARGRRAAAVH